MARKDPFADVWASEIEPLLVADTATWSHASWWTHADGRVSDELRITQRASGSTR